MLDVRILLERKTREYVAMRAKKLVHPEPLDFVQLWNDYVLKRRVSIFVIILFFNNNRNQIVYRLQMIKPLLPGELMSRRPM